MPRQERAKQKSTASAKTRQATSTVRAHGGAQADPLGPVALLAAHAPDLDDGRLQSAQRQALAREIGQVCGNHRLQRAVAAAHSGDGAAYALSRRPAPAPPGQPAVPAFKPVVMAIALPGEPINVGDEHIQLFDLVNLAQVPPGTTFTWVSAFAGETLDQIEGRGRRQRGHYELWLRGMAPGSTSVGVSFGYEVPGQAPDDMDVSTETVTVNPPYLEMAYLTREGPGGEALPGTERLRVGEFLRIRAFMGNVSSTYARLPVRARITGLGLVGLPKAQGVLGALSLQGARVLGPGEYEFLFRAHRVGRASFLITPLPGRTPPEAVPGAVDVDTHVEMGKEEFLSLCNQVNTKIDAADRAARAWLASLSLAYGKAYKGHTDTLRSQSASDRLAQDLILGAALAFIPGGVGGLIGRSMTAAGRGAFIVDGVKDLAKWGMRTGGAMAAQAGLGSGGLNAFPTDPLAWKNQVELRMNSELLVATKALEGWQDKANRSAPDFFLDFNPVEAMEQSLTVCGKKAAELQPVDQEETAKAFEKGMWATWLEQYAYTLVSRFYGGPGGTVRYQAGRNLGKKIERRCKALGLDVDKYARVARERVEAEAERLNPRW